MKSWKFVITINNGKATKFAHSIDGITGASNFEDMWKNHYQQLYNCTSSSEDIGMFRNYVQSMSCAISKQKTGKAFGPD